MPGNSADGHDPDIRRLLEVGPRDFVAAGVDVESVRELGDPLMLRPPGAPLWFEPHDLRFDFETTADGAQWIDQLAAKPRSALDDCEVLPAVVGHFDWRVQNLGFASGKITAIYDWDSLAIVAEYEQASQRPFDDREKKIIDAANLYACAYGARCQHSDTELHPEIGHGPVTAWIRLLQERADQTL